MSEEKELPWAERYRLIKLGLLPKTGPKKKKPLRKVGLKKQAEDAEAKEARGGGDGEMDLFFKSLRKGMKNKCIFCGSATMKNDDEKFHFSLAHLLPKAIFKSVATNPDNIIELCFWNNSCHTQFDNGRITWEFIKDSKEWDIIKEKLLNVLPVVTMEERGNKLYSKLESLIYKK
jgi:hypothetical protein